MKCAIVSERISDSQRDRLMREGFRPLPCPASDLLPEPISHHPDSLLARVGDQIFCYEGYKKKNERFFCDLQALCPEISVEGLPDALGALYPEDCRYNLLVAEKNAFYHPRGLAPTLARKLCELGYRTLHTRQGYTACTTLMLDGRHAITADAGMADVLSDSGISVLRIESGGILLPPYDYGFIGGASGVYKDTVYFYGDVTAHPSYGEMKRFAEAAGFSLCSLSKEPLHDLGGILFLE